MGKSSPTKMQIKHIPDVVILETIFCLQNTWTMNLVNGIFDIRGDSLVRLPTNKLGFYKKRTVHFDELCAIFKHIPKKLLYRKLQKLEEQRKLASYGPSCLWYRVED